MACSDVSGSMEGAGGIGGLLSYSHAYKSSRGAFTNINYYYLPYLPGEELFTLVLPDNKVVSKVLQTPDGLGLSQITATESPFGWKKGPAVADRCSVNNRRSSPSYFIQDP
jgi:hypothetical protein